MYCRGRVQNNTTIQNIKFICKQKKNWCLCYLICQIICMLYTWTDVLRNHFNQSDLTATPFTTNIYIENWISKIFFFWKKILPEFQNWGGVGLWKRYLFQKKLKYKSGKIKEKLEEKLSKRIISQRKIVLQKKIHC